MENVTRSNRIHISIFGKRNAGKSSLINAITNQDLALVSNVAGTTTDPVYKSMEILPIGPVVVIDTAGLDDTGDLGELRVKKTIEVLNKTDVAIIVLDSKLGFTNFDKEILNKIKTKKIPYIIVQNKIDIDNKDININEDIIKVSATTKDGIEELKKKLGDISPKDFLETKKLVSDLFNKKDVVVLVTPIDSAAPKGRIILPQQQVARDILDNDGIVVICKEFELEETLNALKNEPALIITDSQAFAYVKKRVPKHIPLIGFSILFARFKGDLKTLVDGAYHIDNLKNNANILISEGCTHHRQKDDIGEVKIPKWLKERTNKDFNITLTSGHGFTEDIKNYDLIIHCGACMLNDKELQHRISYAKENNVPIVNYGVFIAYINGILERSLEVFNKK